MKIVSNVFAFVLSAAILTTPFMAQAGAEQAPAEVKSNIQLERQNQQNPNAIYLTPNKTQLLRIPAPAASVIVSNPTHANVLLDTPQTLILIPRTPGTTSFMVLDRYGKVIIEKDIFVTSRMEQYVRIKRACGTAGGSCVSEETFYCPDGCHNVSTTPATIGGESLNVAPIEGGAPPPPNGNQFPAE